MSSAAAVPLAIAGRWPGQHTQVKVMLDHWYFSDFYHKNISLFAFLGKFENECVNFSLKIWDSLCSIEMTWSPNSNVKQ